MPSDQKSVETPVGARRLRRGDVLELVMEKTADRGKCLAYHNGQVVFVPHTVAGERVQIKVVKRNRKFAEARPLSVLESSPNRTTPRCRYFGSCGGCTLQHVAYAQQLKDKHQLIREVMTRQADLPDLEIRAPLGMAEPYGYRNKMEFSFSSYRWLSREEIDSDMVYDKSFALGLHPRGNFAKVLDINECHLQSEKCVALLNGVRDFTRKSNRMPWNWRQKEGYLRNLVIRESAHMPEFMANLVTFGYDEEFMLNLGSYLQDEYPYVTTLVNTINTSHAQTTFGERIEIIYGPGIIRDRIHDLTFEIAPGAFFQTNTLQAENLMTVVQDLAGVTENDHVYDLYCGTGTIALSLARSAARVTGIELVEDAVRNAKSNAALNAIENCTFVSGDMLKLLTPTFAAEHDPPDIIVVDPPRAGMHPKVAARISQLGARTIVYVSCNIQSQARDLTVLSESYRAIVAQPIDLFPHTHHIENIVLLKQK
ncbi:MAG: 23S rRNA (uracil(1939)-C(5))-methyltransferase RlmD [Bacteroidota bacterium]|nr:23S rRNA (uracil(1939)-C(5))-methyltransferase RlmD [Bacteroidota bacterium]